MKIRTIGASGFEEPTVCVGAFPVISIALIVGPLVLSFVLALALGGLVKVFFFRKTA